MDTWTLRTSCTSIPELRDRILGVKLGYRKQLVTQLVNKPLSAAGVSEDNAQCSKHCPKNEQLAEKRTFEGNCEILNIYF